MYAPAFLLAFFLRKRYYINMYKVLRILFCAVAVAGAACTVFIFIYFGVFCPSPSPAFLLRLCFFSEINRKPKRKSKPP